MTVLRASRRLQSSPAERPALARTDEPGATREHLAARAPDLALEVGVGAGREDVDELGEGDLVVAWPGLGLGLGLWGWGWGRADHIVGHEEEVEE